MSDNHQHDHGAAALVDHRGRLVTVLAITATILIAEVVGAFISGSLALLADAGHMLTDVAGLTMAVVAASLARRPATPRQTWGYHRAEILGAAAQAGLLLGVGLLVLVEGIRRLLAPPEVASTTMLIFGVVGLIGNIIGLLILASARSSNLNLRAAFLEVLNDALGSVAVIVAAVVITTTGWGRADAVASLVIAVLIIPRTIRILREAAYVLLESTPKGLDLEEVRAEMLRHPHVTQVHDLHASLVATGIPTLSAHVVITDGCFHDGHATELLEQLHTTIAERFQITHTTIQLEPDSHGANEQALHD